MKSQTDVTLDALIKKVREEGVKKAEDLARGIIKTAEDQAALILKQARDDAERLIQAAEEKIEIKDAASKKSLEQAGRDVMIGVKASIIDMFDTILQQECKSCLSGTTFETLVLAMAESLARGKDPGEVEILVSPQDKEAVLSLLLLKFKDRMKQGVDVNVRPDIEAGFKIGLKHDHVYYDCTDQGLAQLMAGHIHPDLVSLLAGPGLEKDLP